MANNNCKISVIIPVYNVEKYLDRCVKSILTQTYSNLEVILVDDGSTDRSPELCDKLALSDKRIVVIHQENAGLAGARNRGIGEATGDYIGFVDSDDWIETDTYEYSYYLIRTYDADIVQYQLEYAYGEETIFKTKTEKLQILKDKDILEHYMYSTTTGKGGDYSVCVCLFKKELLNGVRFRTGKINEDIDFKYKAFSKAHIMVNSNQSKYYYFQQNESLSMGGLRAKDWDLYDAAEELVKLSANESYGRIQRYAQIKKARTPLSLLCKIAYFDVADSTLDKRSIVKQLTKELRHNLSTLLFSPLPISRRVLALFFAINYKVTEKIIQLAK